MLLRVEGLPLHLPGAVEEVARADPAFLLEVQPLADAEVPEQLQLADSNFLFDFAACGLLLGLPLVDAALREHETGEVRLAGEGDVERCALAPHDDAAGGDALPYRRRLVVPALVDLHLRHGGHLIRMDWSRERKP